MSNSVDDKLPEDFSLSIIEEKAEIIRKYFRDMGDPLVFSAHVGSNMATLKFYSHQEEYSLKFHFTFSNLGDLQG